MTFYDRRVVAALHALACTPKFRAFLQDLNPAKLSPEVWRGKWSANWIRLLLIKSGEAVCSGGQVAVEWAVEYAHLNSHLVEAQKLLDAFEYAADRGGEVVQNIIHERDAVSCPS